MTFADAPWWRRQKLTPLDRVLAAAFGRHADGPALDEASARNAALAVAVAANGNDLVAVEQQGVEDGGGEDGSPNTASEGGRS
jgi:hypothetical protein